MDFGALPELICALFKYIVKSLCRINIYASSSLFTPVQFDRISVIRAMLNVGFPSILTVRRSQYETQADFQAHYNEHRCHSSRVGTTPTQPDGDNVISLSNYRWKKAVSRSISTACRSWKRFFARGRYLSADSVNIGQSTWQYPILSLVFYTCVACTTKSQILVFNRAEARFQ